MLFSPAADLDLERVTLAMKVALVAVIGRGANFMQAYLPHSVFIFPATMSRSPGGFL